MSKDMVTRRRQGSKLLPAVKYALVATLVRRPNTGKTKKERSRIEAEEQRRVRAALKRLKGERA
jgi:hypothetical protein